MDLQKKTITSIFMVPTLKIDREKLKNNGFINGFLIDKKRDHQYENSVYLLFKPENLERFQKFVDEEYVRTSLIIDDYDYEEGYVVLVYKLNNKYQSDFDIIKQGKYSKTSKEFQDLFPRVVKTVKNGLLRDDISLQYRIFNKSDDLKAYWEDRIAVNFNSEMEVWEGFNIENETLNL